MTASKDPLTVALNRLQKWRDGAGNQELDSVGGIGYRAGNAFFADDVIALLSAYKQLAAADTGGREALIKKADLIAHCAKRIHEKAEQTCRYCYDTFGKEKSPDGLLEDIAEMALSIQIQSKNLPARAAISQPASTGEEFETLAVFSAELSDEDLNSESGRLARAAWDAATRQARAQPASTELEFEELLGECWKLAYSEGKDGVSHGDKANEVLHKLRWIYRAALSSAQQERPEPVAWVDDKGQIWGNGAVLKPGDKLFAAPVQQEDTGTIRVNAKLLRRLCQIASKGEAVQQEANRIAELESAIDRVLSDIDDDGVAERADIAVLALRNVRAGRPMHEGLDVAPAGRGAK